MSSRSSDADAATNAAAPKPGPSPRRIRRRRLFIIICMLFPFLLLGVAEGLLRLCGYGGFPPVIVEIGSTAAGTICITDNPGPASYFDARRNKPGSINTFTFLSPKPANTTRIVLAGGSAIKGFPQPMGLAPSAFLAAMLADAWPDRRVEVINLGTTAVASFPVLDMATQALEYEPDLVVVYSGHNEFYGAYGVASMHAAGQAPWALRLHRAIRATALSQFTGGLLAPGGEAARGDRTLMEMMIGNDSVAADDPLRAAAERNLRENLIELARRCRRRGVAVMLCTLPCNERDLAPLGEPRVDHLPPADKNKCDALLAGARSRAALDAAAAEADARAALALAPDHAGAHFERGRALVWLTREQEALAEFQLAIDLDPMPWRAPEPADRAIRQAAGETGAWLCDVRKSFRDASPHGIVGWELMDDHVHPSLAGQALLARSIARRLVDVDGPLKISGAAFDALATDEVYMNRLGDNLYDRYGVAHTLRVLCDIPFYRRSNPDAFERFDRVARELEARMPADVLEAARKWQSPASHPGARRPITGMVGRVLIRRGELADAAAMYAIAQRNVPLYTSWQIEYTYFELVCRQQLSGSLSADDERRADEAIERGEFLLRHGAASSGQTERYCGRLHQLRGRYDRALPLLLAARKKLYENDRVAVDQAIIISYLRTSQLDKARELAQDGAANAGRFAPAYRRFLAELDSPTGALIDAGD